MVRTSIQLRARLLECRGPSMLVRLDSSKGSVLTWVMEIELDFGLTFGTITPPLVTSPPLFTAYVFLLKALSLASTLE